ncbi:MAG: hypothetical protein KAS99_02375 [Candidatus Omnitrophica bacterium]|nr:hypothetical protein [Candidatus Omnitrophota bacterium]
MFKKILKVTPLFLLLAAAFFCFAGEGEKITITTYYPSPYGVYKHMKSETLVIGDVESPPEAGVIRFESLAEPTAGEEGDLYYDSVKHKFMYYAEGGGWNPLGEGEGSSCAWFRSATGCPVDPITNIPWEEKEVKEVSDYPTTIEGFKSVYLRISGGPSYFKCTDSKGCEGWETTSPVWYMEPGITAKAACIRCWGDVGFEKTESMDWCPSNMDKKTMHTRCLYEGYTPTPPLEATYKLYYCCPETEE